MVTKGKTISLNDRLLRLRFCMSNERTESERSGSLDAVLIAAYGYLRVFAVISPIDAIFLAAWGCRLLGNIASPGFYTPTVSLSHGLARQVR
jgi:hypothetical protein